MDNSQKENLRRALELKPERSVPFIDSSSSAPCGDDDSLLPAKAVRRRYSISDMTLWRWLRCVELGFPPPTIIRRRRYWRLGDLRQWEHIARQGSDAHALPSAEHPQGQSAKLTRHTSFSDIGSCAVPRNAGPAPSLPSSRQNLGPSLREKNHEPR